MNATATNFRDLVILIPHQMPPKIVDPKNCEPPVDEDDDKYVAGDHDMNSVWTVGDWLDFPRLHGHQRHAVDALVAERSEHERDC